MQTSSGNDFELKRNSVSGFKKKRTFFKKSSFLKMTYNLGVLKSSLYNVNHAPFFPSWLFSVPQ